MYSQHIRCAHQSAPLHQLSPPECSFMTGNPITVPLYIRYCRQIPLDIIFPHQSDPLHHIPHQSAPFHKLSPSECPFTSGIPITVPPYIGYSHQSSPL
ncbi:unnamed protein product, partial [Staurois parvus]